MNNKLFLTVLASAIATPAIVAPVQTDAATNQVFKDVSSTHWAYDKILEMQKKNVINGYPDGTFKPEQLISRKHVAALLARVLPLEPLNEQVNFSDVPKNHPYYDEIVKVQRAGLFGGSNGKFNPDAPLTRIQMSQILYRAFRLEVKYEHIFPDIKKGTFESDQVSALFSNGITMGKGGLFKPYDPVSRAHYAVFLQRALNIKKDVEPPEPTPEPTVPEPDMDETPPHMIPILEQLNAVQKANSDLFIDKRPFDGFWLSQHPLSVKLYLEGTEEVRNAGLKFITGRATWGSEELNVYTSDVVLTSEGYKNPTERFADVEFMFQGLDERSSKFMYDFRSDKAQHLFNDWIKITYPEFAEQLIPIVEQKVIEARIGDDGGYFSGNRESFTFGNYELGVGVTGFLEDISIDIYYKE